MIDQRFAVFALAIVGGVCTSPRASADPEHARTAPLPKELETVKKLAGTWEGKSRMGDKDVPVTITYEITAGGSAVLERSFPGTPHEMISVYTAEGGKVAMTHYCAMGNHPKMTLTKGDEKALAFEMIGTDGLHSASEAHMHAMTISWSDPDHIREQWTSFDGGKKKEEKVFELARKK
jgi:hypothetical protein